MVKAYGSPNRSKRGVLPRPSRRCSVLQPQLRVPISARAFQRASTDALFSPAAGSAYAVSPRGRQRQRRTV